MGLMIGSKESIEKYYASDRLNQSTLKGLTSGMQKFIVKDTEVEETEPMKLGSLVDCLLFSEEGATEKTYFVPEEEYALSETEAAMVEAIHKSVVETHVNEPLEIGLYPNAITEVINSFGWQNNWKNETRLNKIIERGSGYFNQLTQAKGRKIISPEKMLHAQNIAKSLRESPKTKDFFDRNALRESDVFTYYQFPIYFETNKKLCKALPDIVQTQSNYKTKHAKIHILDLKTMSEPVIYFPQQAQKLRYDIQAAWYIEAAKNNFSFGRYFKGAIDEITFYFSFIVESTMYHGDPVLYKCEQSFLHRGRYGHTFNPDSMTHVSVRIKGWEELLDEYKYYEENQWREDILTAKKDFLILK